MLLLLKHYHLFLYLVLIDDFFKSVSQCVAQAGLEITILSPQSLRCLGYKNPS